MHTAARVSFRNISYHRRKRIARNTWMFTCGNDDRVGIRYHSTTVAGFNRTDDRMFVNLRTQCRTRSSRNRINRSLALFGFNGEFKMRNFRLMFEDETGMVTDVHSWHEAMLRKNNEGQCYIDYANSWPHWLAT
jgi:hypothetical protein